MQVWNQLFRSTATQKKYLSLCLSLSSLSIQNDGKVCNNHGSFRLLHCYTCRNCSSVTIPLMLFGSNPYCSASRFFTALNASKKSWGNHSETHINDKIKRNEITHVISCHLSFKRKNPKRSRSEAALPPLVNWLRLGVFRSFKTEVRELQSSGWRNGQIIHESQFTHRVIFEGHDLAAKDEYISKFRSEKLF